jgi:hypothetical protein
MAMSGVRNGGMDRVTSKGANQIGSSRACFRSLILRKVVRVEQPIAGFTQSDDVSSLTFDLLHSISCRFAPTGGNGTRWPLLTSLGRESASRPGALESSTASRRFDETSPRTAETRRAMSSFSSSLSSSAVKPARTEYGSCALSSAPISFM